MRNMSFMLTTEQIRNKKKTVTRRLGWSFLKPGDEVMACEKCQGIPKGGTIQRIARIRVLSTEWQPLNTITQADCVKEGFPNMTPQKFVAMFCRHMKCTPERPVNRIEFEYV